MGTVTVSVGDEIHVVNRGITHRYIVTWDDEVEITKLPRMCRACHVNESYAEDEVDLMICPKCMETVNTYLGILDLMENAVPQRSGVIRNALEMFSAYDAEQYQLSRKGGYAYIDTNSAAIDDFRGRAPEQHMEDLNLWWQILWDNLHPDIDVKPGD